MLNFSQQKCFWAYKSCWQCTRRQGLDWVGHPIQPSILFPSLSAGCQRLYLPYLFPFYFSSASHDYLPFVHSHPHPTPTPSTSNLGNGWRFPGQDLGELQSHPASLEMQPLLGVFCLMGLSSVPSVSLPVCPPAYQRYRTGVSLAPPFPSPVFWT